MTCLTAATTADSASTRTDTTPEQGYFQLDHATIAAADAILHISDSKEVQGEMTGK